MSKTILPVFAFDRLRMGIDGEGVRTLVGLFGCPLKCKYCINPQSKMKSTTIMRLTPEELLKRVLIDDLYFQATGGGITFGGGEPLLHIKGLEEFARLRPKEWNLWVETSLYVPRSTIERAAAVIDHFVVDIKSTIPRVYKEYTQRDGALALSNLLFLLSVGGSERVTVRVPLIPRYSSKDDQRETSKFLRDHGIINVDEFTYVTRQEK